MTRNEQSFFDAYIEALTWSSVIDCDNETYADEYDLHDSVYQVSKEDCLAFIEENKELLEKAFRHIGYDWSQAGHDFALTRNGHGAGFWDRGLDDIGDQLTEACKPYCGVDLYLGDDDLVYIV